MLFNHRKGDGFIIKCPRIDLDMRKKTLIMGILNVTPDSFSDGGLFYGEDKAFEQAERMAEEGADIIDVGGESTRPGARSISEAEEIGHVIPVIKRIAKKINCPISIDTTKSIVARKAIENGAQLINDISALEFDPNMAEVAAHFETPLILMHMRGNPETMQLDLQYDALMPEIIQYLNERVKLAEGKGVDPKKIIVDPGIGFGKSVEDNFRIIKHLGALKVLDRPLLIGTSRKSFIGKALNSGVEDREEGTAATVALSIINGANIVRVHDVKLATRVARIVDIVRNIDN